MGMLDSTSREDIASRRNDWVVLSKRMAAHGITPHQEKTRQIYFYRPPKRQVDEQV
jgi:hypothetical protein